MKFSERAAFRALLFVAVAIVVALPVLPGHDVPQHLAYVRLMAAWQSDPGSLPDVFTAPDVSSGYATVYRMLGPIARVTSAQTSLVVALVIYVVLFALGVRRLGRAVWSEVGPNETIPATILAPVAPFHPVLCMGLLPYAFALVPFVFACAEGIAFLRTGARRHLAFAAVLTAATAALHGFAAAVLLVVFGLLVAARRDGRSAMLLGAATLGMIAASRGFGSTPPLPDGLGHELVTNVQTYGVVDGVCGTFRISFTHWLQKLEQVIATLVGPFPWREKLLSGVCVLAVFVVHARGRSARPVRGFRPVVTIFAVLAVLAPAAMQIPDDLSLIDFRLITTAFVVGLAALPPFQVGRRVERRGADVPPFALASFLLLVLWARQLGGAADETMQTVRLVDRLGPHDRLLALPMHDGSAWLDERNAVLHYAAVHHTARSGGVTSLFWGRFSPRLPIGYQPGREPRHPFDWAPWELEDDQLAAFTHVLVRWPRADDEPRMHELAARVKSFERDEILAPIACDGECCLFAVGALSVPNAALRVDARLTRN